MKLNFFFTYHTCLLVITTVFISSNAVAGVPKGVVKEVAAQYGFIENKGQIVDQNDKPNKEVKYLYNGNSLHVQLKQNGFSYEMVKIESSPKDYSESSIRLPGKFKEDTLEYTMLMHRIDISFLNSNSDIDITASEKASDYINYYTTGTGEEGVTMVNHFRKVLYKNVYPQIDIEFVLNYDQSPDPNVFKYNFVVHPGGNVNDIKLKLEGANSTSLSAEGSIIMETAYGNIVESMPKSFQILSSGVSNKINTVFTLLDKNIFGIAAGNFDPARTLIIDPVPWASYFGGSGRDVSNCIVFDSSDNFIISGYTAASTNIASAGAHQTVHGGTSGGLGQYLDAFVAKFTNSGQRMWSTYYGGEKDDYSSQSTIDSYSNIYLAGYTLSTTGMATAGAYQTSFNVNSIGYSDAFLVKFNSAGVRQWGTYYGGMRGDDFGAITTDIFNNIILGGYTNSTSGISSPGAQQPTAAAGNNAFLVKLTPTGSRLWATYYGNGGQCSVESMKTDDSANIYITGYTDSTSNLASLGAFQPQYGGGNKDGFLTKIDSAGIINWSTYIGGSGFDLMEKVVLDKSGNILLVGETTSNGLATFGAPQPANAGDEDVILYKFTRNGARIWTTYFGGPIADDRPSILLDNDNNIYLGGATSSTSGISTPGMYQVAHNGGTFDAFLAKLDNIGHRIWATYYGGPGIDICQDIGIDKNGSLFITGITSSSTGISTTNAFQPIFAGDDAFIACFTSNGLLSITNNVITGDQTICPWTMPTPINGSQAAGSVNDSCTYSWISSTEGPSLGFAIATGYASGSGYSPPALRLTTWYRRIATIGLLSDTSNAVEITIETSAKIFVNNDKQCISGNSFNFQDLSTSKSGIKQRKWYLSNIPSDTSNSWAPFKTYSTTGDYTVKLVVISFSGCKDSTTKIVSVSSKPIVGFTLSNTGQCVNANSFTFNDTSSLSGATLNSIWHFGEGEADTSTSKSPIKVYKTAGTLTVRLAVYNKGCGDSTYKLVSILPKPLAGFRTNNYNQCLAGNLFLLDDTTKFTGSYTRVWNLGSGIADTNNNVSTYKSFPSSGLYDIRLISTSTTGCKDTVTKTLRVFNNLNAGFTVNNSSQCLKGNSFIFNDTSAYSIKRNWSFGEGSSDTSIAISKIKKYSSSGTYPVKLVIQNNNCKDSAVGIVSVFPTPIVGFMQSGLSACLSNNNFVLTDTSNIVSGSLSRKWKFSDSVDMFNNTVNRSFSSSGIHTVKLISISNQNCMDSVQKNITIFPQHNVGFVSSTTPNCAKNMKIMVSDTIKIGHSRLWIFDDTISFNKIDTIAYKTGGDKIVKLKIVDTNNCQDSASKIITLYPPVVPVITQISDSILESTPANSYQWYFNWYAVVGGNKQQLLILNSGYYTVKVTVDGGCQGTSALFPAYHAGIEEIKMEMETIIYPNPNSGIFNLITNPTDQNAAIEVYDMLGNKVHQQVIDTPTAQINLSNLSKGIYLLKYFANSEMITRKMIVE